jgi:hypothetical protein
MNLRGRLEKLRRAAGDRPRPGLLSSVILCPVAEAGGRPPGLYRSGRAGSTAGVYVYDPAAGEPVVPAEHLAPWALVIGGDARPDP